MKTKLRKKGRKKLKGKGKVKATRCYRCLGVDQSLNGTAIALVVNHKVEHYTFITPIKKLMKKPGAVYAKFPATDQGQLDRLDFIRDWINRQLFEWTPDAAAMEDYAFGGRGQVFNLGELGGIIKLEIFQRHIPLRLYDPLTIKLFATGDGTSQMPEIVNAVEKRYEIDLSGISKLRKDKSRNIGAGSDGDVADAISIADMLCTELEVRAGEVEIKNLTEAERRIFNRVTKKRPDNLLYRPLIKRGE